MGVYTVRAIVWDQDGGTTDWHVYDELEFRVVSNEPELLSSLLNPLEIYRNHIATIVVNIEDVEDSSEDLDIQFEYSLDNQTWNNEYLNSLRYEFGEWIIDFLPPITSQIGFYDFRVRAIDTDGTISDWYDIGNIQVMNSPPFIENIVIRKDGELDTQFFRNETGSVFVYVNDEETISEQINVTVYHRHLDNPWEETFFGDGLYSSSDSCWIIPFQIPSFAEESVYEIWVVVTDLDNEQSSMDLTDAFFVINQPPVVLNATTSEYLVNEGASVTFTGESYDDRGILEHQWSSSLHEIYLGHEEQITISYLIPGIHEISYSVMDDDGYWSEIYTFTMRVNQIPQVDNVVLSTYLLLEGDELDAEYFASDDIGLGLLGELHEWYLDGELYHNSSLTDNSLHWNESLSRSQLTPGIHILSVRVIDSDGAWSDFYEVEFRVNVVPVAVIDSITSKSYRQEDPRYTTVDLQGHGEDDIEIVECEWRFVYLDSEIFGINVESYNWTTSSTCNQKELTNFTAGNYTFSLRVRDSDGIWSTWESHPPFYVDDGDDIGFEFDVFPLDNSQWYDRDGDGCGSNRDGINGDAFDDDPTECLDTDGDGIGDNSDFLPEIHNTYAYAVTGSMVALIGAALAEFAARRSLPGVLAGLENLTSMGITDADINKAIENLSEPSGLQFFSSDLSEAKSLLENYTELTGSANQSMLELQQLKDELAEMEADGISSPEISKDISEIEEMIDNEVSSETNEDYLQNLKEED